MHEALKKQQDSFKDINLVHIYIEKTINNRTTQHTIQLVII